MSMYKLEKFSEWMDSVSREVVSFHDFSIGGENGYYDGFKPFHKGRKAQEEAIKDGYYLTIRCGLSGIYTCFNEWKNGRWQVEVCDDSETIAFRKFTDKELEGYNKVMALPDDEQNEQ